MKIAIFYHVAQVGLGAFVYQQQIHRLHASGLIRASSHIHIGVNGDQELFNVPKKAIVRRNEDWTEETETLISLSDFCSDNPDYKVLYFHTKGVSSDSIDAHSWRLNMEYFIIDRWRECVSRLDEYDCVGANLLPTESFKFPDGRVSRREEGTFHFSGNFWWANATHINSLNNTYLMSFSRYDREFWIGSNIHSKPYNMYDKEDPYHHSYSEKDYIR